MVINVKNWYRKKVDEITATTKSDDEKTPVKPTIAENFEYLKSKLTPSFDVKYRKSEVDGIKFGFVMLDGMCDNELITKRCLRQRRI